MTQLSSAILALQARQCPALPAAARAAAARAAALSAALR